MYLWVICQHHIYYKSKYMAFISIFSSKPRVWTLGLLLFFLSLSVVLVLACCLWLFVQIITTSAPNFLAYCFDCLISFFASLNTMGFVDVFLLYFHQRITQTIMFVRFPPTLVSFSYFIFLHNFSCCRLLCRIKFISVSWNQVSWWTRLYV